MHNPYLGEFKTLPMRKIVPFFLFWLVLNSCEKPAPPNPFDSNIPTQESVDFDLLDPLPHSIAGLYLNIFKPTCANVGCHDGTFEPDFRTLKSTYHTLVHQVPIKNDGNLHTYRVHPYDPAKSILMARINGSVNPPMPIQIEPDSDWELNREKHVENIKKWIQDGAPDIMGNPYQTQFPVFLEGFVAFSAGRELPRRSVYQPIQVPDSLSSVDLYFSLSKNGQFDALKDSLTIQWEADHPESLPFQKDLKFLNTPIYARGLYGDFTAYHYKVSLDLDLFEKRDSLYFLTITQAIHETKTLTIPHNEALYNLKKYMALQL
jgi:hypothetical protein